MNRIICIGKHSEENDSAGPRVFDQLAERELPDGVEVVDGSLSGLNLLGLVEESERVIFVDTVTGFGKPGEVLLIDDVSLLLDRPNRLDPDAGLGLGNLLTMIDQVVGGPVPEIMVVGLESPCTETALWRAVEMSIVAATREAHPRRQEQDMKKDLIA